MNSRHLASMRPSAFWLICLLLAACHREKYTDEISPPEAYIHFKDRVAARMLRWGIPWRYPCTETRKEQGLEIMAGLPTDQCVKVSGPQRFRGLWNAEFEGSRFCPEPARQCSFITPGENIWLDFSFGFPSEMKGPPGGLYQIDFIGRRTIYRGAYGHGGGSDAEIIADRIVSIRRLKAPPPPTRDQVREFLKAKHGK